MARRSTFLYRSAAPDKLTVSHVLHIDLLVLRDGQRVHPQRRGTGESGEELFHKPAVEFGRQQRRHLTAASRKHLTELTRTRIATLRNVIEK